MIRAYEADATRRWIAAAFLLVGWFGLTALELVLHLRTLDGIGRGQPWPTWMGDVLYAPFTFLTPQAEYADGESLTWAGELGRLFGIALPVLTLFWAFQRGILVEAARLAVRTFGAGHVLIVGEASSADRLALASSLDGDVVVLLDPSLDAAPERVGRLGRAGVIMPAAASLDRQFAIVTRAGEARDVVAWLDDAAAGLSAAMVARRALPQGKCELTVAVETPEMQRALRQAPALLWDNHDRIRPISEVGMAMRAALAGADLVEEALRLHQSQVTVRLHGETVALRWAAEFVLRQNWSARLGPPILILDPHRENEAWREFLEACSGLIREGQTIFGPAQAPRILRAKGEAVPITRHIVDTGTDVGTIERTLALAARLRQETPGECSSVQAVLRETRPAEIFAHSTRLCLATPIVTRGERSLRELLARPLDEAAARLHLGYRNAYCDTDLPAKGDWRALAEAYVHSNRAVVDHRAVKLSDAAADDAVLVADALAIAEHHRWATDKLLDGWLPGSRNDLRRWHPDLVPWAQLNEAAREKDRLMVRELLASQALL